MYGSTAKAISHYRDKQKFTETPNFGRSFVSLCVPQKETPEISAALKKDNLSL